MGTQNVTATRSGTTFNIDVTLCDLLPDLTIKDFRIFYDGVFFCEGSACTAYTKTSATNLQYNGTNLPSTVIQVRRKTPNNVIQTIQYANRFSSSLWNQELDRIIRWREEADLNGVGFSSTTTVATPIDTPFGASWDGNVINPPTANAVYDWGITLAPLASPTFTGDPKAPTPSTADNDTSIATTAYVKNNLVSYAPLSSPALTGNPTATTQALGTDNTTIATTAFAQDLYRPAFSAYRTTNTTTGLNVYSLVFEAEEFDTDNAMSTTTFTVPSGMGGKYMIGCNILLNMTSSAETPLLLSVLKNGSTIARLDQQVVHSVTSRDHALGGSIILNLAATDSITFEVTNFLVGSTYQGIADGRSIRAWGYRLGV